jgi:hypothetical protein
MFSSKFLTAYVAFVRFLVSQLMLSERSFRFECFVACFAPEDFSCHVFLHVSHQLFFVLEQEAAVIAPQEPRVELHMNVKTFFQIELFRAKLALEVCFLLLLVSILMMP